MKLTKTKIGVVAIATVMLLHGFTLPALAADSVPKDEVVYVRLNDSGEIESLYVVNGYTLEEETTIMDYGNYSEVCNLTTNAPLSLADGSVTVDAPAGRYHYQATLEDVDIPWDISVAYMLDGQSISEKDLAGANGSLTIRLVLAQKEDSDVVYRENFALQAMVMLKGDRCADIIAPDATIANVGLNKQLSYIVLPGKSKTFEIQTEVTDFEMTGIQINGIPLALSIEKPNTDTLTDKVSDLQDGTVKLDDGAADIYNGSIDLSDGISKLGDGAGNLQSGAYTLWDGASKLDGGVVKLYEGLSALAEGANKARRGADSLYDGAGKLKVGLSTLYGKTPELVSGITEMGAGIHDLNGAVSAIDTSQFATMTQNANELAIGSQNYLDSLVGMTEEYQTRLDNLVSLGQSGSEEAVALGDMIALLNSLQSNYSSIHSGVTTFTGGVSAQMGVLPQLQSSIQKLDSKYSQLTTGVVAYTEGVSQLHTGYDELYNGISELRDGNSGLANGTNEIYSKTADLVSGSHALVEGADKLHSGSGTLRDGVGELSSGSVKLTNGILKLFEGTGELRDKTSDMDTKIDEEVNKMLDAYRSNDFEYVSFTSSQNTNVNSVQFVIKTADIEKAEVLEMVQEEVEQSKNLIEKLLNLFGF